MTKEDGQLASEVFFAQQENFSQSLQTTKQFSVLFSKVVQSRQFLNFSAKMHT